MEALGVAASIVSVVQVSTQIITACTSYIQGIRDAPSDLKHILIEISTLKGLFESLKVLVGCDPDTSVLDAQLAAPVEGCRTAILELNTLLGPGLDDNHEPRDEESTKDSRPRKRRKFTSAISLLAWPRKQDKAKRLLAFIAAYKGTITLALSTHGMADMKTIKEEVKNVRQELNEKTRKKILSWLVTVNPSAAHNLALSLHQPGTCEWIDKWSGWKDWIHNNGPRGLWIYGIPGAGKTVLSAFLANRVKLQRILARKHKTSSRPLEKKEAFAFYYCHHSRRHDETSHFLRWVLSQLCRQAGGFPVPENIIEGYIQDCEPRINDLLAAIREVAQHFSRVTLSIDAIDESLNRGALARILDRMTTNQEFDHPSFHLLVTSRCEADLQEHLAHFTAISMSNSFVTSDIHHFVEAKVNNEPDFRSWSVELRREVISSLATGAKGMFRWAACHLQTLARLKLESVIRKSLRQAPETLDETYERILVNIPEESKLIVWRALAILCSDTLDTDFNESTLMSAILREEPYELAEEEMSAGALQEIASGLITAGTESSSPDHTLVHYREGLAPVALAHYSVKEYLFSERIGRGPAKFFKLSPAEANGYLVSSVLKTVMQGRAAKHDKAASTFPRYCHDNWGSILRRNGSTVAGSPELSSLVFRFLDPRSHAVTWADLARLPRTSWKISRHIAPADPDSVPSKADILCRLVFLDMYATTTAFLVEHTAEEVAEMCATATPLSVSSARPDKVLPLVACVASHQLYNYLVLLLERGATDPQSFALACALDVFIMADKTVAMALALLEPTVKALIEARANPNPRGVRVTPLQIALRRRKFAVVKILLEVGADPNAIGEPDGWEPPGFDGSDGGESPLSILRRIRKSVLSPTYFWRTVEELDGLTEMEELMLRAGAREFTSWSTENVQLGVKPGSQKLLSFCSTTSTEAPPRRNIATVTENSPELGSRNELGSHNTTNKEAPLKSNTTTSTENSAKPDSPNRLGSRSTMSAETSLKPNTTTPAESSPLRRKRALT